MNFRVQRLDPGLYFVATPIGAARDITLRALDILASADILAAEDTRSLRRLMDIHGIPLGERRLLSYHDHSSAKTRERLIEAVGGGKSVAYASEAGMPLIADPGYDLSRVAADAGLTVTVAPGPSAVLAALTLAGLPTDSFFFAGFLPSATTARKNRLEQVREVPGTLVFYESPKRIVASLNDLSAVLGPARKAALCRELTKKFEEVRRGTLCELAEAVAAEGTLKGEIVLVVDRGHSAGVREMDLEAEVRLALQTMSVKDAADLLSQAHAVPRRAIYQLALKLAKEAE